MVQISRKDFSKALDEYEKPNGLKSIMNSIYGQAFTLNNFKYYKENGEIKMKNKNTKITELLERKQNIIKRIVQASTYYLAVENMGVSDDDIEDNCENIFVDMGIELKRVNEVLEDLGLQNATTDRW